MRDWKSDSAYAFCRSLTAAGWAWEFLRRNPDYIDSFKKAIASGSLNPNALNAAGANPALNRFDGEFGDPSRDLPPLSRAGRRWGIEGQIQDPNCDQPPSFGRVFPMEVHWKEALDLFEQPSPEVDEVVIRPDIVLIAFDLSTGNDPLDAAKAILDRARDARAGQRRRSRNLFSRKFETYLRLLDADQAGASRDEMIRNLRPYSLRDNDAADGHAASKAIHKNLMEARKLQDSPLLLLAVGLQSE